MRMVAKSVLLACCLAILPFAHANSTEIAKQPALHATSVFEGTKTTTVALVQLSSGDAGNWQAIQNLVGEAKARGAEFVVFPESSYLGWLNPQAFYKATTVPGPVTDQLSSIAKQHSVYIAFGFAERGPQVSADVWKPYDAATLIGPDGTIIIHSRKNNVLKNAFTPERCPPGTTDPTGGCSYYPATLPMVPVATTPLGVTAVLVCADAYTYDPAVLNHLKSRNVETIFVVWGVTAGQQDQCGESGFNPVDYASQAAAAAGATVIGANAVGQRDFGRFLPSVYCGYSGIVAADGTVIGAVDNSEAGIFLYQVPLP